MEFLGFAIIFGCSWVARFLDDQEKNQEKEIEKRIKEKLKNDQYVNIRIIEKP